VVVLAAVFQHSPLVFLAARKSGIETVHDLAGKRVMIEPQAAELLAYLKDEGVALESLVRVPHTFGPEALLDGRVDAMSAYSTDEPFLLRQQDVDYVLIDPRAGGIDFYGDCLFTTQKEISEHPERVRAFREASLKGWAYALANVPETIRTILTHVSDRHSRGHLKFEARATRKLIRPDAVELGHVNPGRWRAIGDTYARLGMMPRGFSLEGFLYDVPAGAVSRP
jgi:ABC-type nitrate/sulfonate/bicarbonate transport system substrate-binding protein